MRALANHLRPTCVSYDLSAHSAAIAAAQEELEGRAIFDANGCYGYFKGYNDNELLACQRLRTQLPEIVLDEGISAEFSWLRLSLKKQDGFGTYHLDQGADTGLVPDSAGYDIIRLLLNLRTDVSRKLGYLAIDSQDAPLSHKEGFLFYDGAPPAQLQRAVCIPPRVGGIIYGAILNVSRVLHTGIEEDSGHFLASYSAEAKGIR